MLSCSFEFLVIPFKPFLHKLINVNVRPFYTNILISCETIFAPTFWLSYQTRMASIMINKSLCVRPWWHYIRIFLPALITTESHFAILTIKTLPTLLNIPIPIPLANILALGGRHFMNVWRYRFLHTTLSLNQILTSLLSVIRTLLRARHYYEKAPAVRFLLPSIAGKESKSSLFLRSQAHTHTDTLVSEKQDSGLFLSVIRTVLMSRQYYEIPLWSFPSFPSV